MRLNNLTRNAFVKAAIDDVPQVNYSEQIESLLLKDAVDQLPPKIRAIWKDRELQHFVTTFNYWHGMGVGNVALPGEKYEASDAVKDQIRHLLELKKQQDEKISGLRQMLRSVAYGAQTCKQLIEQLPEFERYLPEREVTARDVPVIANLVAAFASAGWKPAEKRA